jgi:CRISPR-associated endonuclease/helicase Cas3
VAPITINPWALWAKWSRTSGTGSYHPVLCHLIDVAMTAEALWQHVLPTHWKERIAAELELDPPSTERCVAFWAGLHDIGKICPGFQLQLKQSNPDAHALVVQRLKDSSLSWAATERIGHGKVTARALRDILPREYSYTPPLTNAVAVAIGGHHGVFPSYGMLRRLSPDAAGDDHWQYARVIHTAWLADAVGSLVPPAAPQISHATAMQLAGLVSVADWIGSSSFFLPHAAPDARQIPSLNIQEYRDQARERAHTALDALGWTGWVPSSDHLTFPQLFNNLQPRPLQQDVIAIAATLDGPACVIVESPAGEGKSEAAMYLADHWSTTLGQRGAYFALPTQATTNSMFERVQSFLQRRYPEDVVNLQLLHGHAALSETLKDLHDRWRGLLTPSGIFAGIDRDDTIRGEVVAAEWFSDAKRALLAPFGVGTVDQALLAALQIKHVFVRLFGLSTKTVIIDEAHAYDTYMSTLLERLLEWLGAFGVPVVLLSATLPRRRRHDLLAAYAKGAGWTPPTPRTDVHYPRITWVSAAGCDARHTSASELNQHTALVEWLPDAAIPEAGSTTPFAVGQRLTELLINGGCAAVICNTVGRAQRVYQALKPYFPGTASDGMPTLDLLHARYPHELRTEREQRVLARFGTRGERPQRAVVVATQIIEQSLDLDFDLMVTDLAPTDLILQRMGRLHRHQRHRPAGLEIARLIILQQTADADEIPVFDQGSVAVYHPHILLRSYLALRSHRHVREQPTITLPDDIEPLVEAVYGDDVTCPANANPALRTHWDTTLADLKATQASEQREAKNRYINHPRLDDELAAVVSTPREEDDTAELPPALRALTRLADETVSIVCLAGTGEHPLLRPGGAPINLQHKPSYDEVEELLQRSVSLANRRIVRLLRAQPPPPRWDEIPLLRHYRSVIFDAQGNASIGQHRIRLDPDLGIVID